MRGTIRQNRLAIFRTMVLGMSMKKMAKRIGVSAPLICQVEKGIKRFGPTTQEKFSDAFGVDIMWDKPRHEGQNKERKENGLSKEG